MTLDELCIKSAWGIYDNPNWGHTRIAGQIKATILEWEKIKALPSCKIASKKS